MNFVGSVICVYFFLTRGICDEETVEVFHDDFETLDLGKWKIENPQNVRVQNGVLLLTGKTGCENGSLYRSNSYIGTRNFTFKYGELLIRMKYPYQAPDLTTGLSVLKLSAEGATSPREVTLTAINTFPRYLSGLVRYNPSGGKSAEYGQLYEYMGVRDLTFDYHLYRLIWTTESMELFMDGSRIFNLTVVGLNDWPAVNIAMSASSEITGNACPNLSIKASCELLVDYVTVRQYGSRPITTHPGDIIQVTVGVLIPTAVVASVIVTCLLLRCARQRRIKRREGLIVYPSATETPCDYGLSALEFNGEAADVLANDRIKAMEIQLDTIQIASTVLGRGLTSVVRKGFVKASCMHSTTSEVAVKSVKDKSDPVEARQLIQELKIMAAVKSHPNILNLVGVVLKGELLLIVEYAKFGCLKHMLKVLGTERFYNHVSPSGHILPYDELEVERIKFSNTQSLAQTDTAQYGGMVLSTQMLLSFAGQICRGMEYLSASSIVHRDLAARNILICEGNVAKVSDFGLALQGSGCADRESKDALPVRWMPPESISSGIFSEKSDVWSFGVLMWEMFSLGALPYAGFHVSPGNNISDFLTALQTGLRLDKSATCPSVVYDLMCECWKLSPADRTNFGRLAKNLENVYDTLGVPVYVRLLKNTQLCM
ncbi:vascular endothelial growth factor receptor 1-like isoform X2 [Paramacrobiotus metropolitanus]|uniref:vascular endothelial growth factor receptor 1-like isoform X2 n=1 Tax=Paramacrobiotus metropolitanus TaxID=2943436 RepID=UPI002446271B|nr:vascular endothelial growth factor receptor 1-like isoform X2 [Paramacrobiotus metropolitanus]